MGHRCGIENLGINNLILKTKIINQLILILRLRLRINNCAGNEPIPGDQDGMFGRSEVHLTSTKANLGAGKI